MSDAFSSVSTLKLLVDVDEYVRVDESVPEFKGLNPLILEFHIDLVTCADEVVKKVLREIYQVFGVRVKPKSIENKFIL
jgi:phosphatidylinositol-4,5-bisphosphate 3-kinase